MENILDEQHQNESEVQYAGFWRRFAAAMLDGIVMYFFSMVILGIAGISTMDISKLDDPDEFASFVSNVRIIYGISIGLNWLYCALMESSTYQATLGKMAMGIKVATVNSLDRPNFGQATGRFFGKFLSSIILGIGYLMMLWSKQSQTLHDSLSGCVVVKK